MDWKVIKRSNKLQVTITNGLNQRICEVKSYQGVDFNDPTTKEANDNARLIVQAPRLLEICKEALRMYESVQPAGGWQGVHDELKSVIKDSTESEN